MKTWHKTAFILSFILIIISWALALYYWNKLPQVIPTHFNFSGTPDAWSEKSILYTFLLPVFQTIMFSIFIFLYYKPQYSNMPTTLWLTTLDKTKKDHAFELIKTMNTILAFWLSLFFAYLTFEINNSAVTGGGPNPFIMIGMLAAMIVFIIYWNIKVYKETKIVIQNKL